MRLITDIIEPQCLSVVWQKIDSENTGGTGRRYIVGKIEKINENIVLSYFKESKDFLEASKVGFNGYSIFDTNQETHKLNVMSVLSRRIPPRHRADFDDFLRYYRIDPNACRKMSDFALLGYTEAKLPGDGFSFVHTFKEASTPCELILEIAGTGHYIKSFPDLNLQFLLLVNTRVVFRADHNNPHDQKAIIIETEKKEYVGHIDHAQADIFNEWLHQNKKIEGFIERISSNKKYAQERPRILIYVRVSD